jgi:hypothetical protein
VSINWVSGDKHIETLDATTGRLENNDSSQISKKALFRSFRSLCNPEQSVASTYSDNKNRSIEYQRAKKIWVEAMRNKFHTCWSRKPSEVDDFSYEK